MIKPNHANPKYQGVVFYKNEVYAVMVALFR